MAKFALLALLTIFNSPVAKANGLLILAGGTATGVGALGSIISGIVWGVKANEEYCEPSSSHPRMVSQTQSYTCSRCTGGKYSTCYVTTCYHTVNYCGDTSGGNLQSPLVRRAAGYNDAAYTTAAFLSLTGVGVALLVAGFCT